MTKLNTFFLLSILTLGLAGCGNAAPESNPATAANASASIEMAAPAQNVSSEQAVVSAKPKMIDFGSKQCQACKAMEPVLESLAKNHAEKFITEFIDVWVPENQAFAKSHNISSIPTQVFFDADGKEIYRNTGFISEEAVLAKWAEYGLISNAAADLSAAEVATSSADADADASEPTTSGE